MAHANFPHHSRSFVPRCTNKTEESSAREILSALGPMQLSGACSAQRTEGERLMGVVRADFEGAGRQVRDPLKQNNRQQIAGSRHRISYLNSPRALASFLLLALAS